MHALPPATVPQHVAIIMDGNRRWASQRSLPRALGHSSGARRVRKIVEACSARGVRYLTLFAFSTENWQRPADEVSSHMGLLVHYLQNLMASAQALTPHNSQITLSIAANYGGRWDMVQAVQAANPEKTVASMDDAALRPHLAMVHAPDPALLIRTGGKSRISNFMQWPDFSTPVLDKALAWFSVWERRFGASGARLAG